MNSKIIYKRRLYCLLFIVNLLFALTAGNFAVADVIIDNGDPGTSSTGAWAVSGGSNPYDYINDPAANSLWSRDGDTYTWQFDSQPAGLYEVYMWWSGYTSRASSVNVDILHGGGTNTVNINQKLNAGKWNSLGQYYFNGNGSVKIIAANGSTVSTCADAVWFRYVSSEIPSETIIDNSTAGTSSTGTWAASGAGGYYGTNSLWSRDGSTYTWTFNPLQGGQYDLSMWWTVWPSRSTSIPVDIEYSGGTASVYINQQQNGGQWNPLGTYDFQAGVSYRATITSQPGPSSTCADAVKFTYLSGSNSTPFAVIDSPVSLSRTYPGETVTFTGHGQDSDGVINAYSWRSDRDGQLGDQASFSTAALSAGAHTIFFKVKDDKEKWSPEVSVVIYRISCDAPVRIMPLGDSITYGVGEILDANVITGYRQPLYEALVGAGHNIDFVGGRQTGQRVSPPYDIDHQGIGGITDSEVANNVYSYLTANPADIVLLHIGTNAPDTNPADVEMILNEIDRYSTEVTVVLARIIDHKTHYQNVTVFNNNIQTMALNRIAQGDKIIIVDQEHALTYPDDMWDVVHPKNSGYGKMAAIWFNALNTIMPVCGEFAPFIYTYPFTQVIKDLSYTYQVAAIGAPAPTISLVTAPPGMIIEPTNGLIEWVPSSAGSFDVTVEALNGIGLPSTQTFTVNVSENIPGIVIDNGAAGTSFTGSWSVSGGTNPYDYINDPAANSVWSRDGATYTWQFDSQPSGNYEVYMWWSGYSTRADSINVDVIHASGTSTVTINQKLNVGQWNSLGQYYFNSSGSVRIIAANGSTVSTCADAVKFLYVTDEGNAAPLAQGDVATVLMDSPVTIDVLGNDTDIDGSIDPSTSVVEAGPSNGIAVANVNGTITYTPTAGYTGTDSFTYSVKDDNGATSNFAIVTVTVKAVNAPPVTVDDNATNISGSAVVINVLVNDTDADGSIDQTTCVVTALPLNGSAVASANGTITYTSNAGYTGSDNFTYTVKDDNGAISNESTVTISVSPASTPPVAIIDSITPSPANFGGTVNFSGSGSGGNIIGYRWRSSRDGNLSYESSFSSANLSNGVHTIYFRVQNDIGWSPEVSRTLDVAEHIFAIIAYYSIDIKPRLITYLKAIGATQNGNLWTYIRSGKKYYIHVVEDIEGMKQAFKTDGANIVLNSHSNYGIGHIFSTPTELKNQKINDFYFIDDDRVLNVSSPWMHVNVSYMRQSQAYPFWWPIFKDGSYGIMPYVFNDPDGDPPYNYYITYQVPGDPKHYKIETVRNSGIERFSDSDRPAWYSETGAIPNPDNTVDKAYYITNTTPWYPSFITDGNWQQSKTTTGYFKENYIYTSAGPGNAQAEFIFQIPAEGDYQVSTWYPAATANSQNVPFTIYYDGGNNTISVNQGINGTQWFDLGEYHFKAAEYSVLLTNDAGNGNVVADAVRISHADNPPEIIQADFYASARSGIAPLTVNLNSVVTGDVTGYAWDFGDGTTNITRDDIDHTYTKAGTYTVRLTVSGPLGSSTRTKTGYITVGSATPPLQAEFSGSSRTGSTPRNVTFRDRSSGNIVSRLWNFGDGGTATIAIPVHTYAVPGNYTVSLTITDANGNTRTETKNNFVRAYVFEKYIDNVDYPKTHYGSKTLLFRKDLEVPKEEMKFRRIMYNSCNSGNYYLDTFNRGIVFYTLNTADDRGFHIYLRDYLAGKTDQQIWEDLQATQPIFDYYDFNKLPSEQQ